MKINSSALLLASALSIGTISSDVHAAKQKVIEEVNVVVKNVMVEGKRVDIVTSLPRNSKVLKNGTQCFEIVQQGEQRYHEFDAEKNPKKAEMIGTDDFWVIDEHNMQRFEDTKKSIPCSKV